MSLRAIPLIAVALILYNAVVLLGGDATPNEILSSRLFEISMLHHNTVWVFTWGDLLILVVLVLLFVELLKATYTTTASFAGPRAVYDRVRGLPGRVPARAAGGKLGVLLHHHGGTY